MSRTDKSGKIWYTIGEKIAYFKQRQYDKSIPRIDRRRAQRRLAQLEEIRKIHQMVYIEDKRMIRNSDKDGHHYLITEIDKHKNIGTNRISHFGTKEDYELKKSYDKKSWFQVVTERYDLDGRRLNVDEVYESDLGKMDPEDFSEALHRRKK